MAIARPGRQLEYDDGGASAVIVGVVLAAGKSTRMGRRKASLAVDGRDTYLTRLVRTFREAGVTETVVVLGFEAAALEGELARSGLPARTVINAGYEAGQLSSLLVGLDAAARADVEAILLGLVDAPFVSVPTVRAVMQRYLETGVPVVRPVRGNEHGHPVLIDRALFEAIRRSNPGEGAKSVVRAHVTRRGDVEVDDEGAFMDIDTPEAHERALRWWRSLDETASSGRLVSHDAD